MGKLTIASFVTTALCTLRRVSKHGATPVYWCGYCGAIQKSSECAGRAALKEASDND